MCEKLSELHDLYERFTPGSIKAMQLYYNNGISTQVEVDEDVFPIAFALTHFRTSGQIIGAIVFIGHNDATLFRITNKMASDFIKANEEDSEKFINEVWPEKEGVEKMGTTTKTFNVGLFGEHGKELGVETLEIGFQEHRGAVSVAEIKKSLVLEALNTFIEKREVKHIDFHDQNGSFKSTVHHADIPALFGFKKEPKVVDVDEVKKTFLARVVDDPQMDNLTMQQVNNLLQMLANSYQDVLLK